VPVDRFLRQIADMFLWSFPTTQNGGSYTTSAIWSLSREFRFYAFFGLIAGALTFIFRGRNAAIRRSPIVLAGLIAFTGITSRLCSYFIDMPPPLAWLHIWYLDLLSLGVFAALLPDLFRKKVAAIFQPYAGGLLAAVLIELCLTRHPFDGAPRSTQVSIAFCSLCFVILVIVAAECGLGKWIPDWVRRTGNIIGDRSYSLYVFHYPVMMIVWYIGLLISPKVISGNWIWPVNQLVMFCLIAPPSVEFLYRKVELPWIARGRSIVAWWQTTSTPVRVAPAE
jgi:peptidoglycan/LPS O-acetylase OafA/YrhL